MANEYGEKGIRANMISPGLTITPMLEGFVAPGMVDAFVKEYPLGRLTTIEDVANAALFIASDECFMTGQTFHVTGGLTLRRNPTAAECRGLDSRGRTGQHNRVGGGLTPAALPHHRTCGSASGGSTDTLESSLLTQQRDQPHACEEDCRQGLVQVRRPGVPPRTTTIASAASSTLSVQPPLT